MKTQICLPTPPRVCHRDYQRAVHQLRVAASDTAQSAARRQRVRAATQC